MCHSYAIELLELVDSIVSNQGFSHEENKIRIVDVDELDKVAHQSLVVLHSSSSIDQADIEPVLVGILQRVESDIGRVLGVSSLEEVDSQSVNVDTQLLHRSRAIGIARSQQHTQLLALEVVGDLRQRRRLAHAVHAAENDAVGPVLLPRLLHLPQNVHRGLGRQNRLDALFQRLARHRRHTS